VPQGRGNVSSSPPLSVDESEKHKEEEEAMGRPKMEKRPRRANPRYTGVEWSAKASAYLLNT
jgi:hypothetical protein